MLMMDSADCILWDAIAVLDTRATAPDTVTVRHFVVYAQRPSYSGKLCELVNNQLVWVADLPGQKEGSAKIVAGVDKLTVWYTARPVGVYAGNLPLWKHDIPVPGVWPLDLAAAMRLRNVAGIIDRTVPSASPAIDPYCK